MTKANSSPPLTDISEALFKVKKKNIESAKRKT